MDNAQPAQFWKAAYPDPFEGLFAQGPFLATLTDADGIITRASPAFARLIGKGARALVGKPLATVIDRGDTTDTSLSGLEGDATPLKLRCENGELRNVQAQKWTMVADGTTAARTLTLFFPVSEDPFAVSKIGEELEAAKPSAIALDSTQSAKARFLAALSHDIRTPMNAIMGFAQLIDYNEASDAKLRKRVQSILAAGHQLSDMIDDLLNIAQNKGVRPPMTAVAVDPAQVLKTLEENWGPVAQSEGTELVISPVITNGAPAELYADQHRVRRVLDGLLRHAMTEARRGTVTLSTALEPSDAGVMLRFKIDDSRRVVDLPRISASLAGFLDGAHTSLAEPWDLSLAICSEVLHGLGGQLHADARVEGGLSLEGEIPLRRAEHHHHSVFVPIAENVSEPIEDLGVSLTVLVVEDHSLSQDFLRDMLQDMGHRVVTAANGYEAIEKMENTPVDLVVLDIAMPGINGLETAGRIRAMPEPMRSVPIMGCTVHVTAHSQLEYVQAGITGLLPKPVDRATLQSAVVAIIRG